jgi:hypothetical protein
LSGRGAARATEWLRAAESHQGITLPPLLPLDTRKEPFCSCPISPQRTEPVPSKLKGTPLPNAVSVTPENVPVPSTNLNWAAKVRRSVGSLEAGTKCRGDQVAVHV